MVGRTPEKHRPRAAEFRTTPYTALTTMVEAEQPDFVSLCLPNEHHFETTLEVIRAGLPLLVEKPLVFEPWQAEYLLAEAAKRDMFFALNFNHRYAVPVQMAAEAIAAGDLGGLVFATWRFGGEPGTSEHPFANLIETQCHGFDMLEHLCGPITSVAAEVNDLTGRRFSTVCRRAVLRQRRRRHSARQLRLVVRLPAPHTLEVNGTAGTAAGRRHGQRFTLSRTGDADGPGLAGGLFDDRGRDFYCDVRGAPRRADPGPARRRSAADPRQGRCPRAGPRDSRHRLGTGRAARRRRAARGLSRGSAGSSSAMSAATSHCCCAFAARQGTRTRRGRPAPTLTRPARTPTSGAVA